MSARQKGPYDSIARRWLALAERVQAHLFELRDSGRWQHYYTVEGLYDALAESARNCERWARIIGDGPEAIDPSRAIDAPDVIDAAA